MLPYGTVFITENNCQKLENLHGRHAIKCAVFTGFDVFFPTCFSGNNETWHNCM